MNQQAGARQVEKMMQQFGCLPSIGESSVVQQFNTKELALALETEINRSVDYGFTKITLHMDLPDAVLLAKELRKL
jgi:hypothetical protein